MLLTRFQSQLTKNMTYVIAGGIYYNSNIVYLIKIIKNKGFNNRFF